MKQILGIAFVLLFVSCSSTGTSLKESFDKERYQSELNSFQNQKLISETDKNSMLGYLKEVYGDSLPALNITYDSLLIYSKAYYVAKKEMESKRAEIDKALKVTVLRKYLAPQYKEGYYVNDLLIEVKCENNSSNSISGFGVNITFMNKNGEVIYSASWPIDKSIKANSTIKLPISTGEYKNTNIEQSKLKMADLTKLTVITDVTELTFDDGTSISL